MLPSTPSDLFWNALSPLVQQLEALGHMLDLCATYYAWCTGGAAGVALLLLTGLVLQEARDEDAEYTHEEEANNSREVQRTRSAERLEWG